MTVTTCDTFGRCLRSRAAFLLVFCAFLLPAEDHPALTIRQEVVRARVDVRVAIKHSNQSLSGLTAEDFTLLENGHPVQVKSADRESVALDLIMMLDVSDSMNHSTEELAKAASDLLSILSPADRIALVQFGGKPLVRSGLTTDRSATEEAIKLAAQDVGKVDGATATYDAVREAVKLFEGPAVAGRRRAILVVTDDIDNSSNSGTSEVVSSVLEHDAVLNAIVIKSALTTATKALYKVQPGRFIIPMKSLKPVAQQTGGEFLSGHDAAPLVKNALEAIRTRYLITYAPGDASSPSGCARLSFSLSPAAKIRFPDAVVHGPRYKFGSELTACH